MSVLNQFDEKLALDIVTAIESNTAPWLKTWGVREKETPRNFLTGNSYRGRNLIKLSMSKYNDPRWSTFKQISEAGGKVLKGEKATQILFYKELLNDEGRKERVIKSYSVFNLEQTSLPHYVPLTIEEREKTIDLAAFARILEEHQPVIKEGKPCYLPAIDELRMPNKTQYASDAFYYADALHELSHYTGHESRLNRDLTGAKGSVAYAKEEINAELSSYLLALETGLPFSPSNSESYLKSWIGASNQETKTAIISAFENAQKASSYLLGDTKEVLLAKQSRPQNESEEITADNFAQRVIFSDVLHATAKEKLNIKTKHYLAVPFEDKALAKSKGAKWDRRAKCWYADNEDHQLQQFIPDSHRMGGKDLDDFKLSASQIGVNLSSVDLPSAMGKKTRVPIIKSSLSANLDGEISLYNNIDGSIGGYAKNYVTNESVSWINKNKQSISAHEKSRIDAIQEQQSLEQKMIKTYIQNEKRKDLIVGLDSLKEANSDQPYIDKKGIWNIEGLKSLENGAPLQTAYQGKFILG